MENKLHNLKKLYYSEDEVNRELARNIIKGDKKLKDRLYKDVLKLYNAIFNSDIERVTKTIQEKIYNEIYKNYYYERPAVDINNGKWFEYDIITELKYFKINFLGLHTTDMFLRKLFKMEEIPNVIWGLSCLNELEVCWEGGVMVIPKEASDSGLARFNARRLLDLTGIGNLPKDIEKIEIWSENLSDFKFSDLEKFKNLKSLIIHGECLQKINYK